MCPLDGAAPGRPWRLLRKRVTRFLEEHVASHPDLEDLAQDVCVRLTFHRAEYDDETGEVFVLAAASESLLKYKRRLVAEGSLHEAYDEALHSDARASPCPLRILLRREALEEADRVALELPERWYSVWRLRYVEELRQAEISERLGLDISTVRNYLTRVRSYLCKRVDLLR